MIYYYMYKITNNINGKVYIGVHKTSNLEDGYMGSGKYLKNAISKYGIKNFEKEILKWFDSEKEMYTEEAELVNEEFVSRKDTYNIKNGGLGGWKHATKIRNEKYGDDCCNIIGKKGIKALKEKYGNNYFAELGERLQEIVKEKYPEGVWKDRKHTEESKKKIGQANAIHQKGENNSQYGKCWIYNLELKENKKILKEDLQLWLDKGWIKGRKMKF